MQRHFSASKPVEAGKRFLAGMESEGPISSGDAGTDPSQPCRAAQSALMREEWHRRAPIVNLAPCQTRRSTSRRVAAGRAGETVVTSTCGHNCGGRCVVNAHVVDDRIVKISTDPARWQPELPPLHACAPRRRPDRAALPSRSPEIPDAPRRAARLGPVRARVVGRGAGPRRPRDAAHPRARMATPPSSMPRARATCRRCTAAASPSASSTSSAAARSCGPTCRPRPRSSRCA